MTKLELRLNQLECHVQGDASGGSEPYLWPMLIWVTDQTLASPALVRSNHPHTPRTVLGQNVTAGAVLAIPPAAGTTGVQLADGEVLRSALAVISLLENDETPQHVVVAAYDSYVRELPAAIARHLLDLSSDDQDTVDAAKAAVRAEVSAAVKSAGAGEMTSWEKFTVGIGSLNLDDQVGSAFDDTTTTKAIGLDFVETSGSGSSARTTQDWHLTGTLSVDTRIDLCATQVRAANQAKVHRDQLLDQLRSLRTARGQARGAEREALDLDIAELEPVLQAAEAELAAAQAALAACRAGGGGRRPPLGHLDDIVVATDLRELPRRALDTAPRADEP
jgi:hypothetical protein